MSVLTCSIGEQIQPKARLGARRAARRARPLKWERVGDLLIQALESATVKSAPTDPDSLAGRVLKRGEPVGWSMRAEIGRVIEEVEHSDLAIARWYFQNELDVLNEVHIPKAEATLAWTERQRCRAAERWKARKTLNLMLRRRAALAKRVEALTRLPNYTRAMEELAALFPVRGIK